MCVQGGVQIKEKLRIITLIRTSKQNIESQMGGRHIEYNTVVGKHGRTSTSAEIGKCRLHL